MSGFGYRIVDGGAQKVAVKEALACGDAMVWVHLTTTAEHAQNWLRDQAKLPDYVIDPLTAVIAGLGENGSEDRAGGRPGDDRRRDRPPG